MNANSNHDGRRVGIPVFAKDLDMGHGRMERTWTFDRVDGVEVVYEADGRTVAAEHLDGGPAGLLIAPAGCSLVRDADGRRSLRFPNGDRLGAAEAWMAAHTPEGQLGWNIKAVRPR